MASVMPVISIGVSEHVAQGIWEQATAHPGQRLLSLKCEAEVAILGDQNPCTQQFWGQSRASPKSRKAGLQQASSQLQSAKVSLALKNSVS